MGDGLQTAADGVATAVVAIGEGPVFSVIALFLAAVFAFSAVPKLRKPDLAALALVDFGVTRESHRSAGMALGAGELGLSVLLVLAAVVDSTALRALVAICAAVVLWTFVAALLRALASAAQFECFCFGGNQGEQISNRTLARTTTLAVGATVLAAASFSTAAAPSVEELIGALALAAALLGTTVLLTKIPAILEVTS